MKRRKGQISTNDIENRESIDSNINLQTNVTEIGNKGFTSLKVARINMENTAPISYRNGFGFSNSIPKRSSIPTSSTIQSSGEASASSNINNQDDGHTIDSTAAFQKSIGVSERHLETSSLATTKAKERSNNLPQQLTRKYSVPPAVNQSITNSSTSKSLARRSHSRSKSSFGLTTTQSSHAGLSNTNQTSVAAPFRGIYNNLDREGKENNDPTATNSYSIVNIAVGKTLSAAFPQERLNEMEELLKFRIKSSKYNLAKKIDDQKQLIQRYHNHTRETFDEVKKLHLWGEKVDKSLVLSLRELREAQNKIHINLSRNSDLEMKLRTLEAENKQAQHALKLLADENTNLKLEHKQLEGSQGSLEKTTSSLTEKIALLEKQKDLITNELKKCESERVRLETQLCEKQKQYDDIKLSRGVEAEKRKREEEERLHLKELKAQDEIRELKCERDTLRQERAMLENEIKHQSERRVQLEVEKSAWDAEKKAMTDRMNSGLSDTMELKAKLQQKDVEMSTLVKSLSEVQGFAATANNKLEDEKKQLSSKVEALQELTRDLDKKDTINAARIRDLENNLQQQEKRMDEKEATIKEYIIRIKEFETSCENLRAQLNKDTGKTEVLEAQLQQSRSENVSMNAEMEALKRAKRELLEERAKARVSMENELQNINNVMRTDKDKYERDLEHLKQERLGLEAELHALRGRVADFSQKDVQELCALKKEHEILRLRLQDQMHSESSSRSELLKTISELEDKIKQGERMRRVMHNTIQELRGNVRVFARTRPFLPSDFNGDKSACESATAVISCDYNGQSLQLHRLDKDKDEVYPFTFDKVFPPSCGQDAVFEEVSEFVQSSLDGYQVCLFSYGQTGSGKTHTMQGNGNGQMRGIIPRAIEKVLSESHAMKENGWRYSIQVSFLEIYNETIKDLLAPKSCEAQKLSIKMDPKGGVYVPDLTKTEVSHMEQVEQLMEVASRARSVACTDMNSVSSRSHSVFTLHLQGMNESEGITLEGTLNLVDLAGSERASRSNVSGDRLRETQAINKSLSCLADVFNAIGSKNSHIPFRNSKLTYLLQSCLSGDGKTLMMVNLSPTMDSANESLCSLRFAQQVNQCELGKPKRQIRSRKDK